jgi:fluoroquinolone transport system permease protein
MNARPTFRALGAIDARSILRDPLLRWMVLLTPALGLLVRYAVPAATVALEARFGFDLGAYYGLIMSFLPVAVAGMIGTVMGFLLLDQRDDQTLSALLVTPLSLGDYLRFRMGALVLMCGALTCVTVPLAGLAPTSIPQLLVVAIVAAPLAPIYALFLGTFATNKVQGFALIKALGVVIVPCIAAYFVAGPWQYLFGLLAQFWPLKVYWLFDAGATVSALWHALVGLAWQAALVVMLARRFSTVVRV